MSMMCVRCMLYSTYCYCSTVVVHKLVPGAYVAVLFSPPFLSLCRARQLVSCHCRAYVGGRCSYNRARVCVLYIINPLCPPVDSQHTRWVSVPILHPTIIIIERCKLLLRCDHSTTKQLQCSTPNLFEKIKSASYSYTVFSCTNHQPVSSGRQATNAHRPVACIQVCPSVCNSTIEDIYCTIHTQKRASKYGKVVPVCASSIKPVPFRTPALFLRIVPISALLGVSGSRCPQ